MFPWKPRNIGSREIFVEGKIFENTEILKYPSDSSIRPLFDPYSRHILIIKNHFPFLDMVESIDHVEQACLAATVGSDQSYSLAAFELQINSFDNMTIADRSVNVF